MGRLKQQVWIDILLLIAVLIVLVTGCILDFRLIERPGRGVVKTIHTYGGYTMAIFVILHLCEYWNLLLNKMRARSK